jgi:hypothetical protein
VRDGGHEVGVRDLREEGFDGWVGHPRLEVGNHVRWRARVLGGTDGTSRGWNRRRPEGEVANRLCDGGGRGGCGGVMWWCNSWSKPDQRTVAMQWRWRRADSDGGE